MKNSMQDVYVKFQKDTNNNVSLFKENVNGVSVDKITGARVPVGNTMFVFRTEIDQDLNVFTGKGYGSKDRQAVYSENYLDKVKATKWLKRRVKAESIVALEQAGYSDIWNNPETLNKAVKDNFEILVDLHIVQQEFAVNLVRYKAGKYAECLNSYKQTLNRYADSQLFQTRFTNHLLQGVMLVDNKLVSDKGLLRDKQTGLFNVSLIETLEPELQAKIANAIDSVMFGKLDDKDRFVSSPKLKVLGKVFLKSSDTKEFIVSYKFIVNTDDALESHPDILIKVDTEDKQFVAFKTEERQQASASNFDMLAEDASEESAPKAKKPKAVALPAGTEEEEEE
jgi:hypothetical protein